MICTVLLYRESAYTALEFFVMTPNHIVIIRNTILPYGEKYGPRRYNLEQYIGGYR